MQQLIARRWAIGLLSAVGALSLGLVRSLGAATLAPPAGKTILTVDGLIENTTDGTSALFDLEALEALGLVTLETATPWTEGVVRFEGVLGRTLLEAVGAKGTTLSAIALNDYVAPIPVSDFRDFDVILALAANGQHLSVRDKGPVFIVYPFDAKPELRNESIYARCVWQLARLTVE